MSATSDTRILSAVADLCGPDGARVTVGTLADRSGVSRRTVLRALPRLVAAGRIVRSGGERVVNTLRVAGDAPAGFAECHQNEDKEPYIPGPEYMPLVDVPRAWRQRLVDFARRGRGPAHLVEAGRCILDGTDPKALSERARESLAMAEVTA